MSFHRGARRNKIVSFVDIPQERIATIAGPRWPRDLAANGWRLERRQEQTGRAFGSRGADGGAEAAPGQRVTRRPGIEAEADADAGRVCKTHIPQSGRVAGSARRVTNHATRADLLRPRRAILSAPKSTEAIAIIKFPAIPMNDRAAELFGVDEGGHALVTARDVVADGASRDGYAGTTAASH